MSVVEESEDNVMLSEAFSASPSRGLGSPIANELINIRGDNDVFARFVHFSSEGVVNLAEKPPQAKRSHDHQVCTQCCIHSLGSFRSSLPYDLKILRSSVAEGKHREEYSLFGEGGSKFLVVRSDEDTEEVAWDQFFDTYGLRKLDPSVEDAILAGEGVSGSGSSS